MGAKEEPGCSMRDWKSKEVEDKKARKRSLKGIIHIIGKILPSQRVPRRNVWRSWFGLHGVTIIQKPTHCLTQETIHYQSFSVVRIIHIDTICRVSLRPDRFDFFS